MYKFDLFKSSLGSFFLSFFGTMGVLVSQDVSHLGLGGRFKLKTPLSAAFFKWRTAYPKGGQVATLSLPLSKLGCTGHGSLQRRSVSLGRPHQQQRFLHTMALSTKGDRGGDTTRSGGFPVMTTARV